MQRSKGLQREAFTSHRTSVVHFQAVELDVCGIAHKRFIRRMHHLATSQFLHDGLSSCRQLRGRLEEKFISSKPGLDDLDQFGPLGLGNGKVCSEVEQRFLLYLAANSQALDQAKGSIGFVGGAAGRCLGYKHSPILAKSKPLCESKIDFRLILWDNIENPGFHINKINVLPTPNRQNRLFIAGKCGTWVDRRWGI